MDDVVGGEATRVRSADLAGVGELVAQVAVALAESAEQAQKLSAGM
ncbi:MAG: hypothetical protein M3R63_21690 [Actinomycetota bacterium]|nr:hypothetical protein [Actinomycetota bacterium]